MATKNKLGNRKKLRKLLEELGVTQDEAAGILTKVNPSGVSVRTLRSWTCDPQKSGARTCDDWVIEALKNHLKKRR